MGRPTIYTEGLGKEICRRIVLGDSLRSICIEEGMPCRETALTWASDVHHPFSDQYTRAKQIQALGMSEELLEIADDGTNDWMERRNKDGSTYEAVNEEVIQRSRMRIDTRKWILSKMLPKTFGEKQSVDHTSAGEKLQSVVVYLPDNGRDQNVQE